MNTKLLLSVCLSAVVLFGCASKPTEMTAQYISPLEYQDYNCRQISSELRRVSRKSSILYGQLEKKASDDQAQMAVGLILLWPTLFFLEGGDGPEAAEYCRLKGEVDALEHVAIKKDCDISEFEKMRQAEAEAKRKAKESLIAQEQPLIEH